MDYSADQLRVARGRLPVVRADGRVLPLRSGSAGLVFSMLTHTDVDGFDLLVAEAVRVLKPGGVLVYVGVHPCFVSPFVERVSDGVRVHPGYTSVGWQARTPHPGTAVRYRVGVHHLPLEDLLAALLHTETRLERVIERGGNAVPEVLASAEDDPPARSGPAGPSTRPRPAPQRRPRTSPQILDMHVEMRPPRERE